MNTSGETPRFFFNTKIVGYPSETDTLPETNIAPENEPLKKEIPIGNHPFLGAFAVSFRDG